MSFSFSSVEDFLKKAKDAKVKQRPEVEQRVRDYLDDPHLIGVAPEMADLINSLMERYGDESLRQIGLFCLGKWFAVHGGVIEELTQNEQMPAAFAATMDATRISDAIALLETVGSFGGDSDWKQMLYQSLVSTVNDAMNQHGEP